MTTTALARQNGAAISSATGGLPPEEWSVLKNSICKNFTDAEVQVFAFRCKTMNLSPLSGQITAFKQNGGVIPIVTIDGYRSIASSIDPGYVVEIEYLVQGAWVDWLPDDAAAQARAKVWRTGSDRPVIKAVSRKEFAGSGGPWRTMPNHMLAKVAESHALRMAYPQTLAGTYSQDEMVNAQQTQQAVVTDITPPPPPETLKTAPKPRKKLEAPAPSTLSEEQLQTIGKAILSQLSDVGREAFVINITTAFGVSTLNQVPAEHFDALMRSLGTPARVELWNQGKDGNGNQVVSEERIAELAALASVSEPVEYLEDPEPLD